MSPPAQISDVLIFHVQGFRPAAKAVKGRLQGSSYRADLTRSALARLTKLDRASRGVAKKAAAKRARKNKTVQ